MKISLLLRVALYNHFFFLRKIDQKLFPSRVVQQNQNLFTCKGGPT